MSTLDARRRRLLEQLFAAINRHDSAGVMACMTADIVLDAAAGPEVCGRRLSGTGEVRAAFEAVWTAMPDASWQCTSHEVFDDRGLSEWVFRATGKDRQRIEAEGCDRFVFRSEKICFKRAFRKDRPPLPSLHREESTPR
jgi:ketosteroid isomerase-like protein